MKKFFLVYLIVLLAIGKIKGQEGYQLTFRISGITDSVCYLVNYYGDKTYLRDTAAVEKDGLTVFSGDSALPGGIYILSGQSNNRLLEVIVDKDQRFSVSGTYPNLTTGVVVDGSEDNRLFFDYIEFNSVLMKQIEDLKKLISHTQAKDSLDFLQKMTDSLNILVGDYKLDFISNHPESFVSTIFRAMKDPDTELAMNTDDPFSYIACHYWDDFDLNDERLLRTPLYQRKLNTYFNKIVYQHPDSIVAAIDNFIDRLRGNKEMFKYTVWFLTFKYETSKIMGFDEIFVHMADRYYKTGEAFWADSLTVAAMVKRAGELRPILLGSVAPELILIDTLSEFISLHSIQSDYLLVLFYESDCGHCNKEIDLIKEWSKEDSLGIKVYAVCTDTSLVKWKKFIVDKDLDWINVNGTRSVTADYHKLYNINMTPTIYLLDYRKKIIAKRLKTEQLKPFLEDYHSRISVNREFGEN